MKVKDAISILKNLNPELEILTQDCEEITEIKSYYYMPDNNPLSKFVRITVKKKYPFLNDLKETLERCYHDEHDPNHHYKDHIQAYCYGMISECVRRVLKNQGLLK
jgi:hypothetical protein